MRLFFSLLGRFITISFAVICALLSVVTMFAVGIYLDIIPQFTQEQFAQFTQKDVFDFFVLIVYVFNAIGAISVKFIGALGVPLLIAIIASELMQWRSLVSYFLLGAGVSVFAIISQLPQGANLGQGTITITLTLGFTGGFIYWLIAGRRAGAWMKYLNPPSEQNL